MRFFLQLLQTSMRASMSNRGAFLLETVLMMLNDLIFFFIWWIFFTQFDNVKGWQFSDMTALMAIGLGGYGLMQILFGGLRNLSQTIVNGDLDPFLTQPKNVMLHVAGSRSLVRGWGHFIVSLILIVMVKGSLLQTSIIVISILSGCLIYASFSFIVHSLAFWSGPIDSISKKYCDALFLFALYPTHIYSGFLQLVMFTLIPAGIIGSLPVELVRSFCWVKFLTMVASALLFVGVAIFVFHRGLRRYASGNLFGSR
jgi:ABC-2 type transport system permease protein